MISVIIPVHNVEPFLHRCVDSILSSTYKDFEIILIENGSTDNSPVICREYAERYANIRLIVSEIKGVSHARNLGLEAARGDWVTFVDSDDYVSPYMLEILHTEAEKHHVDFVYSKHLTGPADDYEFERPTYRAYSETLEEYYYQLFVNDCGQNISLYNKLYTRELALSARFDESMTFGEDVYYICMVVARSQHILKVNTPLYYYYNNPNSICRNIADMQKVNTVRIQAIYGLIKSLTFVRAEIREPEVHAYEEFIYTNLLMRTEHRLKQARKYHMPDQIKELKPIRKEAVKHVRKAKHLKPKDKLRILWQHYAPVSFRLVTRIARR